MVDFARITASDQKDLVFRISSIKFWIENYPKLKIYLSDQDSINIDIWDEDYFANAIESLRQAVSRL